MTDSFAALAQDIDQVVGFKLFTALLVAPPFVERVYTNMPDAFPMTGRKRLDASPWAAHVIDAGQVWLGLDAADMRHMFPDHELIASVGCGACINIPVQQAGRTIGTLNMLDAEQAYTDDDVTRAAVFAARAVPLFSPFAAQKEPSQ